MEIEKKLDELERSILDTIKQASKGKFDADTMEISTRAILNLEQAQSERQKRAFGEKFGSQFNSLCNLLNKEGLLN